MTDDSPELNLTPASVLSTIRDAGKNGLSLRQIGKTFSIKGDEMQNLKFILGGLMKKRKIYSPKPTLYKISDRKPATVGDGDAPRPMRPEARLVGVFHRNQGGSATVQLADKRKRFSVIVLRGNENGAEDGDLVQVDLGGRRDRDRLGKVVEVIGHRDDPAAISLIALHEQKIRTDFPSAAVKLAEDAKLPDAANRTDFTLTPLVTIDGADARDFDDAVHAVADTDERNAGGYILTVAIADVAYYVRPEDALDEEAILRGNSVYFPDRVVPMLPEALSNGLCSLMPDVKRGCLAMIMRIDKNGKLLSSRIKRGIMKSKARLTYEQVQMAKDGHPDEVTKPLLKDVITPLYEAYTILDKARKKRGALDLDLPERVVKVEKGKVASIEPKQRLDSHKLIEEFMILANVSAAQLLENKRTPLIYRVHDKPSGERLMGLQNTLKEFGLKLNGKGKHHTNPQPSDFAALLRKINTHAAKPMLIELILRSQSQAIYTPHNLGHFGLALERYAHFTSPIRRYADLIVHRALIAAYDLGEGGDKAQSPEMLADIAQQICENERRAVMAERSALQRYLALYMKDKTGAEFTARISGVRFAGLFLTLTETGADGFLPRRLLPQDYYLFDEKTHTLVGQRNKTKYRLGQPITVRLVEAIPVSGELTFEILGNGREERRDNRDDRDDRGGGYKKRPYNSGRGGARDTRKSSNYRSDRNDRSRPDSRGGKRSDDESKGDKPYSHRGPAKTSYGKKSGSGGYAGKSDDRRGGSVKSYGKPSGFNTKGKRGFGGKKKPER